MRRDLRNLAIIILVGLLVISMAPVWASGDCKGHSCNDGGDINLTGGDVNVAANTSVDASGDVSFSSNDTSRAFGFGLGDVDINDCYRSYQVLIYQDSKLNKFCVAQHYAAMGNEAAYQQVMCSIGAIKKLWDDKASCLAAHTLAVMPQQPLDTPEKILEIDHDEDEEERFHVEQQELYEDLLAKIRNLEEAQNRSPVVRREVVEQRVGLTAEQKAMLREVKE